MWTEVCISSLKISRCVLHLPEGSVCSLWSGCIWQMLSLSLPTAIAHILTHSQPCHVLLREPHRTSCVCVSDRSDCWWADALFYHFSSESCFFTCCVPKTKTNQQQQQKKYLLWHRGEFTLLSGKAVSLPFEHYEVCSCQFLHYVTISEDEKQPLEAAEYPLRPLEWDFKEMACSVTCRWG